MSNQSAADYRDMIVGMIFNVMVAIPLVLMVIQFARTKQPEERRRPAARRPDDTWETYQRTMGSGGAAPVPRPVPPTLAAARPPARRSSTGPAATFVEFSRL